MLAVVVIVIVIEVGLLCCQQPFPSSSLLADTGISTSTIAEVWLTFSLQGYFAVCRLINKRQSTSQFQIVIAEHPFFPSIDKNLSILPFIVVHIDHQPVIYSIWPWSLTFAENTWLWSGNWSVSPFSVDHQDTLTQWKIHSHLETVDQNRVPCCFHRQQCCTQSGCSVIVTQRAVSFL